MNTDKHGAAKPQPKISPQRPGAARIPGSARFQRANGDPTATTCTPEACAPRKTREKFLSRRPRIWRLVGSRHQDYGGLPEGGFPGLGIEDCDLAVVAAGGQLIQVHAELDRDCLQSVVQPLGDG